MSSICRVSGSLGEKVDVKYFVISTQRLRLVHHMPYMSLSHFQFWVSDSSSLMDCLILDLTASCIRPSPSSLCLSQSLTTLTSASVGFAGSDGHFSVPSAMCRMCERRKALLTK